MLLLSSHISTQYRRVPKCKYLYLVYGKGESVHPQKHVGRPRPKEEELMSSQGQAKHLLEGTSSFTISQMTTQRKDIDSNHM